MAIPILYYFGNVAEGHPLLAEHPKLEDWARRMTERQSFRVTKPQGA